MLKKPSIFLVSDYSLGSQPRGLYRKEVLTLGTEPKTKSPGKGLELLDPIVIGPELIRIRDRSHW